MKIAFAGSRDLCVKIIEWVAKKKQIYNVEIVGGISPDFHGWWGDKVKATYKKFEITEFPTLEKLIDEERAKKELNLNEIMKGELVKTLKWTFQVC